jgi:anti-anti-sigma factor
MEFQLERRKNRLYACGDMTIYNATVMREQCLAAWRASERDFKLDLSNVSELDTCGLQVLLLLQRMAQAERRALKVLAVSDAAREVFNLCGLQALHDASQRQAV